MNIKIIDNKLCDIKADITIVIAINKDFDHPFVKPYKKLLKKSGFGGSQDEVSLLVEQNVIIVAADSLKSTSIRPAVASAIRAMTGKPYQQLA